MSRPQRTMTKQSAANTASAAIIEKMYTQSGSGPAVFFPSAGLIGRSGDE